MMQDFHTESFTEPDMEANQEKRHGLRRFLLEMIETLLLSLVLFSVINAVSARIRIESISMQPTLYAGDFVIVNKLAYKLGQPDRGDVIVFRFPPDPQREPYIKRVIGLPGDTVRITDGKVYVNDTLLEEPYISAPPAYEGSWNVPDDSLFVLGDNRNSSSDSHQWGMVPLENVIGKAVVVYWPPTAWKLLDTSIAVAASNP